MIARLFSLLYASALEQVTTMDYAVFEVLDLNGFDLETLYSLKSPECGGLANDRCEVVLQWIQKLIVQSDEAEIIKVAPPILSRVYNELAHGIVNLANARKITEFPIPFPFAQMVTFMLCCHWATT